MATWTMIGFNIGIRSIESAYCTSKKAFEQELQKLTAEWEDFDRQSNKTPGDFDDQYADHLSELAYDAEKGSQLLCEAFALIVYHYWEKKACNLLHLKSYNQDEAFNRAKQRNGIKIDESSINRLRLIANTVKHDNGYPLYQREPTLFDRNASQLAKDLPGWHFFLRLSDADVESGIAAVKASGPRKGWEDDSPVFEDD